MSEAFDPYLKWLGIAPEEQPPNHYRLLGVPLYIDDPDVIENAADRQMSHLRSFQSGKNAALSQKLLNEISAAKVCLLDATKRAAYDKQLKAKLGADQPGRAIPSKRLKVAKPAISKPAAGASSDRIELDVRPTVHRAIARSRKPAWQSPVVLGAAACVVLLLIAGITWLALPGGTNEVSLRPVAPPNTAEPDDSPNTESDANTSRPPEDEAASNDVQVAPAEVAPADNPTASDDVNSTSRPDEPQTAVTTPDDEPVPADDTAKPDHVDETTTAEAKPREVAASKRAIPDTAAQKRLNEEIRGLFDKEIAAARTPEEILELAKFFLEQARQTTDDADAVYVMLDLARRAAAGVGDAEVALAAVAAMAERYSVEPWELRTTTLTTVGKSTRGAGFKERALKLAKAAQALVDEAIRDGQYHATEELLDIALEAAKKAEDIPLRKAIVDRADEVELLARQYREFEAALEKLGMDEGDPVANLVAGRFYCFVRGDWLRGLPLLAKSGNDALRQVAQLEVAAPADVEGQTAVGDAWWDLSDATRDDNERGPLQQRALHWYRQALPQLTNGLVRTKIEKRIAEVAPPPTDDDVQPQTVYLDDEDEIDSKVANGTLGKHGWREDGKKRAQFKGVQVEHCLSMHAIEQRYSYASYPLNGQYQEFQAIAAVLDNPQEPITGTPLVFRVIGDGKLLWQSQPIQQSGTGQPCRVAVHGVRQLTLRVDCPGSGRSAWSAWIEPRVTRVEPRVTRVGAKQGEEEKPIRTARPLPRNLKFLFIMHDPELKTAKEACRRYGYPYETADSFDAARRDYRGIHTIMAGSNAMDYWGKDELKVSEAFQNIDAFVRAGGHLIVTGSFNGRNNEHLKRYGITTSFYHSGSFAPTAATAVFFLGNERIIPPDRKMQSAGNFKCSEPHTVLLARGPGSHEGEPAVITLSAGKGRVTFTLCEPEWQNDLWLVDVLIHWTLRGAPTE